MAQEVSSLIKDLSSVPNIVGSLGLSIAAAQKAFNLDYLENLERLLATAKSLLGSDLPKDDESQAMVRLLTEMVLSLAPSRYQFTETTLNVKLDLAQTGSTAQQAGLGINTGAVAINAAMTSSFGYDARSAAEVTTVLHAISPDRAAFTALLAQAAKISDKALVLPKGATVDQNIVNKTNHIFTKLLDKAPIPITRPVKEEEENPPTGGTGGGR
jgi:hypothetical protein